MVWVSRGIVRHSWPTLCSPASMTTSALLFDAVALRSTGIRLRVSVNLLSSNFVMWVSSAIWQEGIPKAWIAAARLRDSSLSHLDYGSRSYDIGWCGTFMNGICYIIAEQYWEAWRLFWKRSVSLCFLGVLFGFGCWVVCVVACCLVFCVCWWHLDHCLTFSLLRGNRQSKQDVLMTVWASSAHGTGKKKMNCRCPPRALWTITEGIEEVLNSNRNANFKAMGYAVCKNQNYLKHVMFHDNPMHRRQKKKIELSHVFF